MKIDTTGSIGSIITVFLILINVGGTARASVLILGMMMNEETEVNENKKKLRNLIIFLVLANTITGLARTVLSYYV